MLILMQFHLCGDSFCPRIFCFYKVLNIGYVITIVKYRYIQLADLYCFD